MQEETKAVLNEYSEMAKNPKNHSLFDLAKLLQKVKKEQARLDKQCLINNSIEGDRGDGGRFCLFHKLPAGSDELAVARKNLEHIIEELENG